MDSDKSCCERFLESSSCIGKLVRAIYPDNATIKFLQAIGVIISLIGGIIGLSLFIPFMINKHNRYDMTFNHHNCVSYVEKANAIFNETNAGIYYDVSDCDTFHICKHITRDLLEFTWNIPEHNCRDGTLYKQRLIGGICGILLFDNIYNTIILLVIIMYSLFNCIKSCKFNNKCNNEHNNMNNTTIQVNSPVHKIDIHKVIEQNN